MTREYLRGKVDARGERKGDKRGSGWCQNSVESGWMTSGPGGAEWMQGWTAARSVDLAPVERPIGLKASRLQLPVRLRLGVFQPENLECPLIPSDTYRGGGIDAPVQQPSDQITNNQGRPALDRLAIKA